MGRVMSDHGMRIGIYGGSFDPIHHGHLELSQTALRALNLDKIILVPSSGTGHYKEECNIASNHDRLAMLHLATDSIPQLEISTWELDKPKFTYTIHTLRHFRDTSPDNAVFYLLVGGDWKNKIHSWYQGEQLLSEFHIAFFSRPGEENKQEQTNHNVTYINMPLIDVSSSVIREKIKQGKSIHGMVPQSIENYIQDKELYR
jgi:nicotinate-nucleotide adenylyltransferase